MTKSIISGSNAPSRARRGYAPFFWTCCGSIWVAVEQGCPGTLLRLPGAIESAAVHGSPWQRIRPRSAHPSLPFITVRRSILIPLNASGSGGGDDARDTGKRRFRGQRACMLN